MRIYRLASLAIATLLLTVLLVTPALSAASSSSTVLTPLSLSAQSGNPSGSLSSLALLDQSGSDDNPAAYLSLTTPDGFFSADASYQLPSSILPSRISALLLQVNFNGPPDASQVWSWSIFNWKSQLWIKIGDTIGTQPTLWNNLTFRIRNFSPAFLSNRQIRIRIQSNNSNGDAKLDYQALHVTFSPVAPTPTRLTATPLPSKDIFVLPTTLTPTPTPTPTITPSPTITPTFTPSKTPTSGGSVSTAVFAVGTGGSDVIPHQLVRTAADKLYIFANMQGSQTLRVYRQTTTGLPNAQADFAAAITVNAPADIISVDAVYDGGHFIHAIVNTQGGQVLDYPFDTNTNTFNSAITLVSSGSGTIGGGGLYVGTSGVAGMFDLSGNLHVVYWTSGNQIFHRAYTSYNSSTNTLSGGSFVRVDSAGRANHPAIAVSPSDNSVTVAWVSQAATEKLGLTQILARTLPSGGSWAGTSIETVSSNSVDVWTDTQNGINIDQGPSLLIDSAGVKHLIYIEECCELGGSNSQFADYGRVHYVTNSGSGWTDTELDIFSHDPALAMSTSGNMYIIGHGHPNNFGGVQACFSMSNMCYIKKNANGTWGTSILFAAPPNNDFDASPSVKWSVVGWNRPNAVEFIFFKTPYENPTIYYGRLP